MLDNYHSLLGGLAQSFPLLGQAMLFHRNTRGQPMSFVDMPYLAPLYKELPTLNGADIRKGVQTGLSELFIALSLYHAGWNGKIVAYVMPTFSIRDRFVNQRINKVLMNSKEYRSHLPFGKDLGNNRMKRFGSGSLLFLGSNTTGDFVEFSADTLIIDELDQCDPSNLAKARDRLRASRDPRMFRLGNPTYPNRGVCELFEKSNQRYWFTKCYRCNHWQSIDWHKNIVTKDDSGDWIPRDPETYKAMQGIPLDALKGQMRPVCEKCHRPFDRNRSGEWVAIHPSRERHGFTISRLDVLSQCYIELYQEWMGAQNDVNKLSTFYTSVLGQGFEYSGARITIEMLSACANGEELDYAGKDEYLNESMSMGIDVGSVLNFCISKTRRVEREMGEFETTRICVLAGAVKTFEELQELIERYSVTTVVIDSMPETRKAQELRDWGRELGIMVWLCRFYPTPRIGKELYGRKIDWRTRVVTVDRTQVMDATFDEIRSGYRVLPTDITTVFGFFDQMKAPVRILDQDRGRIIWNEGNQADHYRFADVYDRVASDISMMGASYGAI